MKALRGSIQDRAWCGPWHANFIEQPRNMVIALTLAAIIHIAIAAPATGQVIDAACASDALFLTTGGFVIDTALFAFALSHLSAPIAFCTLNFVSPVFVTPGDTFQISYITTIGDVRPPSDLTQCPEFLPLQHYQNPQDVSVLFSINTTNFLQINFNELRRRRPPTNFVTIHPCVQAFDSNGDGNLLVLLPGRCLKVDCSASSRKTPGLIPRIPD
jgi:hypothetical protein